MNVLTSLNSFTNFVATTTTTTTFVDFTQFIDMSTNLANSFTSTSTAPYGNPYRLYLGWPVGTYAGKSISISNKMSNGNCVVAIACSQNYNKSLPYIKGGVLLSIDSGSTYKYIELGQGVNGFGNAISTDGQYLYQMVFGKSQQYWRGVYPYDYSLNWTSKDFSNPTESPCAVSCSDDGKYVCLTFLYVDSTYPVFQISNDYGVTFTPLNGSNLNSSINVSGGRAYISWISNDGSTIYFSFSTGSTPHYLYKLTNVISGDGSVNSNPTLSSAINYGGSDAIYSINLSSDMTYIYISAKAGIYVSSNSGTNFSNIYSSIGTLSSVSSTGICDIMVGYGPTQSSVGYPYWSKTYGTTLAKWSQITAFSSGSSANLNWDGAGINREGSLAAIITYDYGKISASSGTPNNKLFIAKSS